MRASPPNLIATGLWHARACAWCRDWTPPAEERGKTKPCACLPALTRLSRSVAMPLTCSGSS